MLERFGVQAISFGTQILLARILLPEEFGIVATVAIILALATVFTDSGMGSALIQNPDINKTDLSTVFTLNLLLSILIFAGLSLSGPAIARFFEAPVLVYVLPALAIGIVITAIGQTQMSMLQKNMEFDRLLKISIPASVASAVIGISMALSGWGVWALVGQRLTQNFVFTAGIWKFCNPEWRPRLGFSMASLKKIAGFSAAKLTNQVFRQVARNLHGVVIAKAYSMGDLAFYNRAGAFQKQPITAFSSSLNRVMFPVFSEIQHDNRRIRKALRRGIPPMAFLIVPAMFWLIAVAEPLILFLLTDKWLESIPYLRVFPLIGIAFCFSAIKNNVINGKGLTKTILVMGTIKPTIQMITLWFTWPHGIMVMLIGQVCCAWFNTMLNDLVLSRLIDLPIRKQLVDWIPYLTFSLISCACSSLIPLVGIMPPLMLLVLQTLVFGAIYLGLCRMFRVAGMRFIIEKLSPMLNRNREQADSAGAVSSVANDHHE